MNGKWRNLTGMECVGGLAYKRSLKIYGAPISYKILTI